MYKYNFLFSCFQVISKFVWEIIFFPLWWYSRGFLRLAGKIIVFWREEQRALGVSVWLKNIFVPMYGQHDFAGRMISFFVRLVQVALRGLALLFWLVVGLALLLAWLILPLALVLAISFQFLAV